MTTFPSFPESEGQSSERRTLRSERYSFTVAGKSYTLQFWPMTYLEGYDNRQVAALAAKVAYEVSFRLEDHALSDGTILTGYDTLGTGNAFQVLGGVANGIMDWAQERRPDYLYWYAQGTRRQRLFDRMIRAFAQRGSGWQRLTVSTFTNRPCPPEEFWLSSTSPDAADQPTLPRSRSMAAF